MQLIKRYFKQYANISRACWERIAVSFIHSISRGLFFFLSLYYVKYLHMSVATAGIAISCYGVGAMIGSYLGGKLSDHFDPGRVSIVSLFLNATIFWILAVSTNTSVLMLTAFLWAFFAYAFLTSNHAWILKRTRHHEAERLKTLNILYAAANLGIFASAGVVGFSADYGFETIFIGSGITVLVTTAFLIIRQYWPAATPDGDEFEQSIHIDETSVNPNSGNRLIFWLAVSCLFFISLIVTLKSTVYTIYLHQSFPNLNIKSISFLFALNPIIVCIFQTPVVNLFHRSNKVLMIGVGAVLMGIGMCILPFSSLFILIVIAAIIYTFGEMIFTVMAELVLYQTSREDHKGQGLGVFRLVYAISMIVGPAIGGYIYHIYGGNVVWYICGVLGAFFLGVCALFKKYYH